MRPRLRAALRGGVAGLVATAGMSAFMIGAERLGVLRGQPPRMIVDRLAPESTEDVRNGVAVLSHGVYGAFGGALFAQVAAGRRHASALGLAYGLLLWGAGYEGWVPAIGVLPPAHRDHPPRAMTMVLAHLIYGYLLGRRLARR